ncbi:MAG: hypothetical protein HKN39_01870 [Flavobacteriales bacterium]|nr:hypothetical protein [Flavobacteriales bacterium]
MVHSSTNFYEITFMRGLLEANRIPSIVLNKQDSAYLAFGLVELHVRNEDFMRAKYLIDNKEGE